jgi:hypothetical protein
MMADLNRKDLDLRGFQPARGSKAPGRAVDTAQSYPGNQTSEVDGLHRSSSQHINP